MLHSFFRDFESLLKSVVPVVVNGILDRSALGMVRLALQT